MTAALLAALAPRPSDEVLELAAGTGDLTEALAGRVARLVATDVSPAMVEAARRRALAAVEYRVLDMQALDLPDASVDAVVCRYGYMLVPDPALALQETKRVLRAGGRLAFATWAPARANPWATAYGAVLLELELQEPAEPNAPGQFALGERERIEELLERAGFAESAVAEVPVEFRYAGWEDYRQLHTSLAAALRQTLAALDAETRAEVDERARARLERFAGPDGYAIPGLALVTRAA